MDGIPGKRFGSKGEQVSTHKTFVIYENVSSYIIKLIKTFIKLLVLMDKIMKYAFSRIKLSSLSGRYGVNG